MNIKETNLMLRQSLASTRELTTQERERYSRGGEIFMEGNQEETPKPKSVPVSESPPTTVQNVGEHTKNLPSVTEKEQQETVRKFWEKRFEKGKITKEEAEAKIKEGRIPEVSGGAPTIDHLSDIKTTTKGSLEELAAITDLIQGDREHIFSPNTLKAIKDPDLRVRIEARAPEIIKEFVTTIPTGTPMPEHLLEWIAQYPEYADQFITRIIMAPFATPTVEYRLEGLYTGTNLTSIIEMIEDIDRRGKVNDENNRGRHYRILHRAVEYYHHMNRVVNSGQIDQYAQISPSFPTEFFDEIKLIPGVAQAKRLYEVGYRFMVEKDGGVNNTNFPEVEKLVKVWLTEESIGKVVTAPDTSRGAARDARRSLENWEITRASDLARSMLTIEFRTAEKISMGDLELVNKFASSPQESATRLTDWFRRMGFKFGIDEVQGGVNLMTRVKEKFRTLIDRKYPWLNRKDWMRLKKIHNTSVDDLELAGIFGVRGVWDGYRLNAGALDPIVVSIVGFGKNGVEAKDNAVSINKFLSDKTKLLSVVGKDRADLIFKRLLSNEIVMGKRREQFLNSIVIKENKIAGTTGSITRRRGELKGVEDITIADILNAAKKVDSEKGMEQMNEILEKVFRPLIEQTTIGLGAMLSSGAISHSNLYRVREMVWEKVIDYDPLIISSMLSKLEFKDEVSPVAQSLNEILQRHGYKGVHDPDNGEDDPRWAELRSKLIIAHETRMKESVADMSPSMIAEKPEGGIQNKKIALNLGSLSADEQKIVKEIQEQGRLITKDLAFIRFPYAVFLDDLPFEHANYRQMGPEFFRRREGSDLPVFAEFQKAWITLVGKASQLNPEERIKQFEAMIDAAGGVLGVDAVQDNITDSLFEADCEFIQKYPWAEQFLIDGVAQTMNKPTSIAQEYGGIKGPSLNTYAMAEHLNVALNHGILRKAGQGQIKIGDQILLETWEDTYDDFRKRRRATVWNIIIRALIDLGIGALLTGPWKFGKVTAENK